MVKTVTMIVSLVKALSCLLYINSYNHLIMRRVASAVFASNHVSEHSPIRFPFLLYSMFSVYCCGVHLSPPSPPSDLGMLCTVLCLSQLTTLSCLNIEMCMSPCVPSLRDCNVF
uniref:Uncharacterized protein n=1 Tax=Cacopsylla melanoneura TaxID=428564 RepID=A0A8D9BD09_9HEMI